MIPWTSPGVLVARKRSGSLLFGTFRSMHPATTIQAASSAARRIAIDRLIIDTLPSRSELNLKNAREIAVLRIVVAVEAVDDAARLRVVALVARPCLEIASDHRDVRGHRPVARNQPHEAVRQLVPHGQLA